VTKRSRNRSLTEAAHQYYSQDDLQEHRVKKELFTDPSHKDHPVAVNDGVLSSCVDVNDVCSVSVPSMGDTHTVEVVDQGAKYPAIASSSSDSEEDVQIIHSTRIPAPTTVEHHTTSEHDEEEDDEKEVKEQHNVVHTTRTTSTVLPSPSSPVTGSRRGSSSLTTPIKSSPVKRRQPKHSPLSLSDSTVLFDKVRCVE
jgi:hypothetical protein